MLPLDHPKAPKFWMNETGGQLVPAMQRYIRDEAEQPDDVTLIRAYLRQWIDSPVWGNDSELDKLRRKARGIRTRSDIHIWLNDALMLNIDPL